MSATRNTSGRVKVRCFCGNRLELTKSAVGRRVICDKCHQPLPMPAIRMAIREDRPDISKAVMT